MGKLHTTTKYRDSARKELVVYKAREHILKAQVDLLNGTSQGGPQEREKGA